MTKAELYRRAEGKQAIITCKTDREEIINKVVKSIEDYNAKQTGEAITYELTDSSIKISNGQFIMLPMKPRTGKIAFTSKDAIVADVYIKKTDIIAVNDNQFETARTHKTST